MEGALLNADQPINKDEPTEIRGTRSAALRRGATSTTTHARGAFRLGGGIRSSSTVGTGRLNAESIGPANDGDADCNSRIQSGDGGNPGPVRINDGGAGANGRLEGGGSGTSGSPTTTPKRGPGRPQGWRKYPTVDDRETNPHQDIEDHTFQVTVESSATVPGEPVNPGGKKEEKPPARSHHRKNPASKTKVDELAESVKDIYSIADSLLGAAISFSGREYPDGLFTVTDEVAAKLAKNLLIVNSSIPRVGAQVSKVAAPMLLLTTFLTDISVKGLVLYGILKSPKPSTGLAPTPKG